MLGCADAAICGHSSRLSSLLVIASTVVLQKLTEDKTSAWLGFIYATQPLFVALLPHTVQADSLVDNSIFPIGHYLHLAHRSHQIVFPSLFQGETILRLTNKVLCHQSISLEIDSGDRTTPLRLCNSTRLRFRGL